MPRLMATVYNWVMRPIEKGCLRAWRKTLLSDLSGEVLEIGAGTGATLPFYPRTLSRVVLCEPDPYMRRRLLKVCDSYPFQEVQVEVLDAMAESLPVAANRFDAVVSSLVLCSVHDVSRVLGEVWRVLKPGGMFCFIEHVAATEATRLLTWQCRIEPMWKRIAGNCHLSRRTEAHIVRAGFEVISIQREPMRRAFPLVQPTIRGRARKQ